MLHIEVFTDPACPFAWSAEPDRRRIQWRSLRKLAEDRDGRWSRAVMRTR
jgi:predicted DsbA family dithiol-disulfide isomerase